MFKIRIKDLVWQDKDRKHIKEKHNITDKEAQQVLLDKNILYVPTYEGRIIAIGKSKKRILCIIITKYSKSKYLIVTAHVADKAQRNAYRKNLN